MNFNPTTPSRRRQPPFRTAPSPRMAPGPGRVAFSHAAAPEARAVRGAAGLPAAAHDVGRTSGRRVARWMVKLGFDGDFFWGLG